MEKSKRSLNVWIYLTFFLSIYNPYNIFADAPLKNNVLSLSERAYVLYESSSYSNYWVAEYLIDGRRKRGWCSQKNNPFPHIIIFELASNAKIDLLKFNNYTRETKYPGISTKEVLVEFSSVSSDSGYISVGSFILEQGADLQEYPIQKTIARWIRLSIKSNYGHPFHTELKEFEAWGIFESKILQIISNFIWILGAAIILAAFSYHEFFAHLQKSKKAKLFKKSSFKKPFLLGMILSAAGISISIQQPWLAATSGVVAFLLLIWFVKFIKTQAVDKQKSRE